MAAITALWAPWREPPGVADRAPIYVDLETLEGPVLQPAISADGKTIAFTAGFWGETQIGVRQLDQPKYRISLIQFSILHISDLHRSPYDPKSNGELISALISDRERYRHETPRIAAPEAQDS